MSPAALSWLAVAAGTTPFTGTLVVLGLVIGTVVICYAMSRSLRTARRNLGPPRDRARRVPGTDEPPAAPGEPGEPAGAGEPVSPPPPGRGEPGAA